MPLMGELYHMKPIGEIMREHNIQLDTLDPVTRGGLTQVPNFILRHPDLSVGAKLALRDVLELRLAQRFLFSRPRPPRG